MEALKDMTLSKMSPFGVTNLNVPLSDVTGYVVYFQLYIPLLTYTVASLWYRPPHSKYGTCCDWSIHSAD